MEKWSMHIISIEYLGIEVVDIDPVIAENITLDFTINDIHKIREQNYERTKDMTVAEKIAYERVTVPPFIHDDARVL